MIGLKGYDFRALLTRSADSNMADHCGVVDGLFTLFGWNSSLVPLNRYRWEVLALKIIVIVFHSIGKI